MNPNIDPIDPMDGESAREHEQFHLLREVQATLTLPFSGEAGLLDDAEVDELVESAGSILLIELANHNKYRLTLTRDD
jgi:hypothetical protein